MEEDLSRFAAAFPFASGIRGKSFLVTGATGLIGSTLVRCLLKLNEVSGTGVTVRAMARDPRKAGDMFGEADVEWFFHDVLDPLPPGMPAADYVVHCASPTSSRFYVERPVETIKTALVGTDNLLALAAEREVESFVYLSSLESYGTVGEDREIREADGGYIDPADVRSSYSLGKRMAECLCHSYAMEYGVPVKAARLTQTFGAGASPEDGRVFAQFARSVLRGEDIVLHTAGESAKPYLYTTDAAMAVFFLLLRGADGEAYNVANPGTYVSVRDMARMLAAEFNPRCRVVTEPRDGMGYAPVTLLRLNTDKLEALGWKPEVGLREMFRRLLEYYKTS